ncbi:MAG TPA: hypothetical protein VGR31_14170 [Planctomycetota bacterium]|jgi:ribonuclease HII|nr:hypothetical protein [Planctomycetota bacterium]
MRASALPFPLDERRLPARVVAGIDEAGLGPLLGPLTIGYSAFRVPDPDIDLWRALDVDAAPAPRDGTDRMLVADSKIVFARTPRGEARLETVALAFLALRASSRRPPASARELLAGAPLDPEPWAVHLAPSLPLRVDLAELDRRIAALAAAAARNGVEPCSAGVRVLPVGELNASFARTDNKSRSHWDFSAAILRDLWRRYAAEGLDLLVDRHGGRMRYEALLRETFPEARIERISEERPRSEYAVIERNRDATPRWMRIAFAERAEGASMAVALASCLAKYTREVCMHAFNEYFRKLDPSLRPTAGYVSDGRRWLTDAARAIGRSGVAHSDLVRAR